MTIDLSSSIAAESGTDTETTTTTDDSEESIPFEPNESTEGYALFANSASFVGAISTEIFGNDPVYSLLEWGMDLNDYPEIVEENNLNDQQKLDLLHKLAKSTFGGKQSELNEGYGMGWDTDESPPKVYDNDEVNHVPYLDVYSDLPAFNHDTLDDGEIMELENPSINEAEALDMDDFGFDRSVEGPQLPVINGERVPIIVQNGDEVKTMLEMVNSIDWEGVTHCEKNGSLQGTPTLGSSEDNTEKPAEESSDEVIDYQSNPERIGEVNANILASGDRSVRHIDSLRTIQTLLSKESDGKARSTVMDVLKKTRTRLQGDDEESDDSEAVDATGTQLSELSDIDKQLVLTLLDNEEVESKEEAIAEVQG